MLLKSSGNECLLLGVDGFLTILEVIVKSLAKVGHKVLLNGRCYGGVNFIVNIGHALYHALMGAVSIVCTHYGLVCNMQNLYAKLLKTFYYAMNCVFFFVPTSSSCLCCVELFNKETRRKSQIDASREIPLCLPRSPRKRVGLYDVVFVVEHIVECHAPGKTAS